MHDRSSIPRRVASRRACPAVGPRSLESRLVADATVPPAEFRRAVAALNAMHPRPELFVTALGRAAPAGPVHLGVQRRGRRRAARGARTSTSPTPPGGSSSCTTPRARTPGRAPSGSSASSRPGSNASSSATRCCPSSHGRGSPRRWSTTTLRTRRWAAPSPRRPRCGSATSPGPAATTTWSCARRGPRSGPELTRHADAFCELVAVAAGLPPVGAVPLVHRTV